MARLHMTATERADFRGFCRNATDAQIRNIAADEAGRAEREAAKGRRVGLLRDVRAHRARGDQKEGPHNMSAAEDRARERAQRNERVPFAWRVVKVTATEIKKLESGETISYERKRAP